MCGWKQKIEVVYTLQQAITSAVVGITRVQ